MDSVAKAAFITAQAACCNARLMAMQMQNTCDMAAGRPITYQPYQFENVPNDFQLGHNDVISYLTEY